MHSLGCTKRKGVHTGMLCKQNLLRDLTEEHRTAGAAVNEVGFRSTEHRHPSFNDCSDNAVSSCDRIARFLERRADRAFAGAARAYLHSSHLIRRA
jgi:hypothetical protein